MVKSWMIKVKGDDSPAAQDYQLSAEDRALAMQEGPNAVELYTALRGRANAYKFVDDLQQSYRKWNTLLNPGYEPFQFADFSYADGQYKIKIQLPARTDDAIKKMREICQSINAQEANSEWTLALTPTMTELNIQSPHLQDVVKVYNRMVAQIDAKSPTHLPPDTLQLTSPFKPQGVAE